MGVGRGREGKLVPGESTSNRAKRMFGSAQGLILQLKTTMGAIEIGNPLPLRTLILISILSSQFYLDIQSQLENDFVASLKAEVSDDGGEEEAIRPLPWYPDNLAWHSNFSPMQLRKNQNLER